MSARSAAAGGARVPVLFGVFVGGQARRLGGAAKGWLATPSGLSIVERLIVVCRDVDAQAQVVLVGTREEYAPLGLPELADRPPGEGPLGGLAALLFEARRRDCQAIALACDLPFVNADLLVRLVSERSRAPALAPKLESRWQPLCARYAPEFCLPIVAAQLQTPERALFRVLDRVGAEVLELNDAEAASLRDWDTPEDVAAGAEVASGGIGRRTIR